MLRNSKNLPRRMQEAEVAGEAEPDIRRLVQHLAQLHMQRPAYSIVRLLACSISAFNSTGISSAAIAFIPSAIGCIAVR